MLRAYVCYSGTCGIFECHTKSAVLGQAVRQLLNLVTSHHIQHNTTYLILNAELPLTDYMLTFFINRDRHGRGSMLYWHAATTAPMP